MIAALRPIQTLTRVRVLMRVLPAALTVALCGVTPGAAQELKPVPKGSERVAIPGCSKGYIFTAGPRSEAQPGTVDIPVGMHLRMNGPKQMLKQIEAHEGTVVVITGLVKSGQHKPDGLSLGGPVRLGAGPRDGVAPVTNQIYIDVEGWRPGVGECPR